MIVSFADKLKAFREKKGMTQAELADAVGVHINTIRNYEGGHGYPKKRELYDSLASVLGVSVTDLRNENDEFIAEAAEKYGFSGQKQAQQLVEQMGGLFAGGELSEEDIDGVMQAMQDLYWKAKKENKKYGRKKSR